MSYKNAERRGRYARALKAAQNLAARLCYEPVDDLAIIPPGLREGLSAPSNALILLPAVDLFPAAIEKAVRDTRSPVIAIEAGVTGAGLATFYFTVFLPQAGEIRQYRAMRLWVGLDQEIYLVPDLAGGDPKAPAFTLDEGLREAATPWANQFDHGFGLAHADAILLAP